MAGHLTNPVTGIGSTSTSTRFSLWVVEIRVLCCDDETRYRIWWDTTMRCPRLWDANMQVGRQAVLLQRLPTLPLDIIFCINAILRTLHVSWTLRLTCCGTFCYNHRLPRQLFQIRNRFNSQLAPLGSTFQQPILSEASAGHAAPCGICLLHVTSWLDPRFVTWKFPKLHGSELRPLLVLKGTFLPTQLSALHHLSKHCK